MSSKLVQMFISSNLDYCNAILNASKTAISRKRCYTRLITFIGRHKQIALVLRQLHWLSLDVVSTSSSLYLDLQDIQDNGRLSMTVSIREVRIGVWRQPLTTIIRHNHMNEWKCDDLKCVRKPTKSRLSLTHRANKSSRWAE